MLGSTYQPASGTFASKSVGDRVYGASVEIDPTMAAPAEWSAPGTRGAEIEVTLATANATVALVWQGIKPDGTAVDLLPAPQNPTPVVFSTGTAAKKTANVGMPPNGAGYKQVRLSLVLGGTGGSAGDTWKVSYTGACWGGYS